MTLEPPSNLLARSGRRPSERGLPCGLGASGFRPKTFGLRSREGVGLPPYRDLRAYLIRRTGAQLCRPDTRIRFGRPAPRAATPTAPVGRDFERAGGAILRSDETFATRKACVGAPTLTSTFAAVAVDAGEMLGLAAGDRCDVSVPLADIRGIERVAAAERWRRWIRTSPHEPLYSTDCPGEVRLIAS